MSHAATDPHEPGPGEHASHVEAAELGDELGPDEPKTPLWLTALGGALFLLLAIVWLGVRAAEPTESDLATAAASASVSAAPLPTPPPAAAPPPPPPPPPPSAPAASAAAPGARPEILHYPRNPRPGKAAKP